jgi:multicomponent K+:H+ antiporter subunit E
MSRLFPHPLLSVALVIVWIALVRDAGAGHLILALLIGIGVPLFTVRFSPQTAHVVQAGAALRLLLVVAWDIVLANLAVVRLVVGPTARLRPAFVEVPLDTRHPFAIGLLASIITMTPGTVSCAVDRERCLIHVHVLDAADPAAVVADIKKRYEAPLKEIFEC